MNPVHTPVPSPTRPASPVRSDGNDNELPPRGRPTGGGDTPLRSRPQPAANAGMSPRTARLPAVALEVQAGAMSETALQSAHALSLTVKWPHRLEDWQDAAALGEGVVARHDGQVAGTGLRWRWGDAHATVGLVIVDPRWQGRGIGRKLMHDPLEPLQDRSVLLHATEAGLPLYEKLGFKAIGTIEQHQGVVTAADAPALAHGSELRPATGHDLDCLAALDAQAAGMPREAAIRQVLEQGGNTVILTNAGKEVGFVACRPFGRGRVIGPVVAPDRAGAQALIGHWLAAHQGGFVRVDVHTKAGLGDWLASQNPPRAGGGTTMVRGPEPRRGPEAGGWALMSQALG
jgi:ribosomal protein S18 acetylase RimI-like enzyme